MDSLFNANVTVSIDNDSYVKAIGTCIVIFIFYFIFRGIFVKS